ncbi:LLM class flavin-dependent oxidoreductase [Amycolatopsis acidiphila]|uniref:LLM class flavin-dependent oxidoreductase n=1 Tax=Amycolatopsis acidiphila TaxID=715473 RepID=A0A558A916_9PSEU|nr:LLM class flavin-dependent oxidoreductase [Amycolatopsis acidiphila]TVT20743.1 LLM class flavin-dependent oxidoreductase [Amycolatopsis acidiphila]UIJ59044.1 LLM class flavin-dependent oxidoreductase [Amycolatopsis acidiphila]GHG73541.1 N5,N10-methylene tetrahydromethanopterin reductase [Amycolatopsis acidiphila]
MKFGLLLPSGQAQLQAGGSARGVVETAVQAEALGFDSVWAGDSMVRARLEPLTLLATIAQATERITLGTAVLIPAYRHPVHAALTITSLDLLSGGRLVLGVGVGFPGFSEQEFDLAGVRFKTRFSQLDDTVELWRQLWTGSPDRFDGKVLHYGWLPEVPRPAQPGGPPIWLGGITPSALRRTAELYDGWLPYPPDPAEYASALATIGRPVTPALFATVYLDDDVERGTQALDAYCRATYRHPLDVIGKIQVMLTGPGVLAQLGRFAGAGAGHVLVRIAAIEPDTFAGNWRSSRNCCRTLDGESR